VPEKDGEDNYIRPREKWSSII